MRFSTSVSIRWASPSLAVVGHAVEVERVTGGRAGGVGDGVDADAADQAVARAAARVEHVVAGAAG